MEKKKRAYPVQRAPALCGVWGRVSVASKYGSKEIIIFSIEVTRPLDLGKAPSMKKLHYRLIDSVMISALSFFPI